MLCVLLVFKKSPYSMCDREQEDEFEVHFPTSAFVNSDVGGKNSARSQRAAPRNPGLQPSKSISSLIRSTRRLTCIHLVHRIAAMQPHTPAQQAPRRVYHSVSLLCPSLR